MTELFSGEKSINKNIHANMLHVQFYVCPICGNILFSIGESVVCCHGLRLTALQFKEIQLQCETIEDELYVQIDSPMIKKNYVSFIAGVFYDKVELKKLYVEGPAEAQLKRSGLKYIYYYDNKEGLFRYTYQ